MTQTSARTVLVVGASRGLGRGIATAFAAAGAPVIAVARTAPALAALAATSPNIRAEVGDATDPAMPKILLDKYEPRVLILVAGANPVPRQPAAATPAPRPPSGSSRRTRRRRRGVPGWTSPSRRSCRG